MANGISDINELPEKFYSVENKYFKIIPEYFSKDWAIVKNDIRSYVDNYKEKINEARKLRIGIVGQIKAGKSTFLNCFLFEGKDVLPKAVTPMTASLTRIRYSDTQSIEIEFFNENDVEDLRRGSQNQDKDKKIYEKILESIESSEIESLINQKSKLIEFKDFTDLNKKIEEYISEKGKYVNVIKSVTINLKYEPIRYIEIVDTPGLNDPVISRSEKTKRFVETCDILFLLSRASQFLEKADIDLLAEIYRKKSAKIYTMASKFDSVLHDAIATKRNSDFDFIELFSRELKKRNDEFQRALKEYERETIAEGIVDKKLLYFSSAFYKKLNNIALSNDEEIPIRELSEKTKNFTINSEISGSSHISQLIDKYKDEKQNNAFKSEIIKKYIEKRIKSLEKTINDFIETISDFRNKKSEDVKKDIEKLSIEIKNFSNKKNQIRSEITDVYYNYSRKFNSELDKFYEQESKEIQSHLSAENIQSYTSKTRTETSKALVDKSGILADVARFFGDLFGYSDWGKEEIPIKNTYKYYDRDLILNFISDFIQHTNTSIENHLKNIFNINEIKSLIIDILKKHDISSFIGQAVNISVRLPENIKIDSSEAENIYRSFGAYEIEIKKDDTEIFETIKKFSSNIKNSLRNSTDNFKKEIEKQFKEQTDSVLRTIDDYFEQEIRALHKKEVLGEKELNDLNDNLKSLEKDLEKIKNIIINSN